MIQTREDLRYYLKCDRVAMQKTKRAWPWNDTYYFLWVYRHYEYWNNHTGFFSFPIKSIWRLRFKNISLKCGFSIPINTIGPGLCLPHYGTIIISDKAKIGENCKIHAGVNIGATSGEKVAKTIGDNVYIGPGAKIIGRGIIANGVVIGANAVVTGDIREEGITVGGVPAKKISNNDSAKHVVNATKIVR